jgi:hypothetical protein
MSVDACSEIFTPFPPPAVKLLTSLHHFRSHQPVIQNVVTKFSTRGTQDDSSRSRNTSSGTKRNHIRGRNSAYSPMPSYSTTPNTTYRQPAASSQRPSYRSPAPRSTTKAASRSTLWSPELPSPGGRLSTSRTTRDLRPTLSPDSPNTRARHWEARTRSARVAPRGQQAVRRETERLGMWHLPWQEMVGKR